jgi:large subunit ribosomal protein L14
MIYPGTILNCNDNSGAITVKCINIWNFSKWRGATAGSIIVVTIKNCLWTTSKVQKGSIQYAIITWTKSILSRPKTGDFLKFTENSVVLIANKKSYIPIGTRVLGPVAREVWKWIFIKIVLLSAGVF